MPMNFDAIIIGTGFGGTIATTKLAAKGKKVMMLERGTFWVTPEKLGQPPAGAKKPIPVWAKEQNPPMPVQYWPRPNHREGLLDFFASIRGPLNNDGLYQYSMFKQADILTASGVGGGSLIYSNVTLRPQAEVLLGIGLNLGDAEYQTAYKWMEDFRGKLNRVVTKIPLPGRDVSNLTDDDYLYLDRARALRDAAKISSQKLGIQMPWEPLDLSLVEYDPDRGAASDAAKNHTFCERQGRCILGCLPAARHTLNKTLYGKLLSDPTKGVSLSPLSEVRDIKQIAGGYEVRYRDHRDGNTKTLSAPMVFLAGGTLGTTEILLRSRDRGGLKLTAKLGTHFSTNGDFGAFCVGTTKPVYTTRGPINTSGVHAKFDGLHIHVEDAGIPEMLAAVTSTTIGVLDNFAQREALKAKMKFAFLSMALPDLRAFLPSLPDTYDPTSFQTEAEMMANIFFFNAMGQDDASGKFTLDNDNLKLDWDKKIGETPIFGKIETLLQSLSESMGGRYVPFPFWKGLGNKKLTVTHPLGGCPIAPTSFDGVVDELGRVFDGNKPAGSTDVYPGLYVVDGSAIPGALAINPTLTIAAQALKSINAALP
ncbi:MAG: GMC family oxidoreductase [Blastocatellia bacterium]|nr:GMC family oxidoreductase [Blastocatellia bacterium]